MQYCLITRQVNDCHPQLPSPLNIGNNYWSNPLSVKNGSVYEITENDFANAAGGHRLDVLVFDSLRVPERNSAAHQIRCL
jgi:hypothetical protein